MSDTRHEPDDEDWPEGAAPDEAFIDATLGRILNDPDVKLSILLSSYRVPDPSADFVARTLARVAVPAAAPVRAPARWPLLLAAAGLALAAGLWFQRPPADPPSFAPNATASFATGLGRHAALQPHGDTPPLDGFFLAVSFVDNDGAVLLAGGPR